MLEKVSPSGDTLAVTMKINWVQREYTGLPLKDAVISDGFSRVQNYLRVWYPDLPVHYLYSIIGQ
jgi:hypothetical protein